MKAAILLNSSFETTLPIAMAWEFLTDPSFLVSLDPKTRIESIQNDCQIVPGAVVTIKLKKYGKILFHIDDVILNRKFVFHHHSFPAQKCTCEYLFTESSENRTRIDVKVEIKSPLSLILRIFHRPIKKALIKNFETVLHKAEKMQRRQLQAFDTAKTARWKASDADD